jgi:hypothetical protein
LRAAHHIVRVHLSVESRSAQASSLFHEIADNRLAYPEAPPWPAHHQIDSKCSELIVLHTNSKHAAWKLADFQHTSGVTRIEDEDDVQTHAKLGRTIALP